MGWFSERRVQDEGDEFLALEEAGPHRVALARRDDERHRAAERGVALAQQARVELERHEPVHIAVDREKRDPGRGERGETVDGVMAGESGRELLQRQPVGGRGLRESRVAGEVAYRIDAGEGGHLRGMINGPVDQLEAAAAATEQHRSRGVAASPGQFGVQRREPAATGRAAVGLADVDAGDGDAGAREALEHPAFRVAGVGRQCRRVPDPRLRPVRGRRLRGGDEERRAAVDPPNLAR
jgi:hypothetical protein